MKINPIQNKNIVQNYRANRAVPSDSLKPQSKLDEVSFSEQAISFSRTLQEVREQMELRSPAERADIADIASRVQAGEYHVDSRLVADKMLRDILL